MCISFSRTSWNFQANLLQIWARIRQIYERNLGAFQSKLWPGPTRSAPHNTKLVLVSVELLSWSVSTSPARPGDGERRSPSSIFGEKTCKRRGEHAEGIFCCLSETRAAAVPTANGLGEYRRNGLLTNLLLTPMTHICHTVNNRSPAASTAKVVKKGPKRHQAPNGRRKHAGGRRA